MEEYPAWLWLPWGHSLWLAGLYVPVMESRDRDAPPDWPGIGTVKVAAALEKLGFEGGTPRSEVSPREWSWSMEGPAREGSVNWLPSDLGFLAACVAYKEERIFVKL